MSTNDDIIFGLHAVSAALAHDATQLTGIWVEQTRRDPRLRAIIQDAERRNVRVHPVGRAELDELCGGARHQGAVARRQQVSKHWREDDLYPLLDAVACPLLLVLDGVQDPHNLGACLRSADAAGVHAVIAPADRAVGLTPAARKVASGAAETVPFIQVTNLARCLRELQERGLWLVGAAGEVEQNLYTVDFTVPTAIVLGAEEKGLRRLTREICDVLVRIPMAGQVASLNVSVATGVFLFEAVRQRTALL